MDSYGNGSMRGSKVVMAAALLLVPAAAQGQTLGQIQWLGTGQSFKATYEKYAGYTTTVYAGAAYQANALLPGTAPWYLQGSNGFGPAVDIYCVDFVNTARKTTYAAWYTNLGYDALTKTRDGDVNRYRQVAWLTTQMELQDIATDAGRQERAVIHAAIWRILGTDPKSARANGTPYGYEVAGITNWMNLASTNSGSVRLEDWTVVTAQCVEDAGNAGRGSVADNCGQEFLVQNRLTTDVNTTVPEPGTMLLMGTGLLAMFGLGLVGRGGLG